MVRLTYMSQATSLAEHPNFPTAVGDLCVQAQRLNRQYGLTGALIVSRKRFIQTLEGDPEAVFATLARINLDLRHFDLRIFEISEQLWRHFGKWVMHVAMMERVNPALISLCIEAYRRPAPPTARFLLRALEESAQAA
jgi:hypothetical protein